MAVSSATSYTLLNTFMLLISITACARLPHVVIRTKFGALRGLTQVIPNAHGPIKTIDKFLGIPYAASPTGELRFAPPQPFRGWNDTIDATNFKSICMQSTRFYSSSIRQAWEGFSENNVSEDCLYLNVYTPANASSLNKRYPVLAYVHGGGFFAGTPIQVVSPGEYLPTRGIVLVTIQYRLGAFGFFSTGNSTAPGNYGMLDQVQAMKWIRDNIESFGGDGSQVTLFGESAGGASVNLHLLSPLSEGLFHRVIAESGTDLSPFAFEGKSNVSDFSKTLARKLGCTSEDAHQMMACLRRKDAKEILHFASSGLFFPTVDEHFLHDSPINLRKMGKFQKVPVIAGFVSDEGSFLLHNVPETFYDQTMMRGILTSLLSGLTNKADLKLLVDAVQFQYTPWPDQNNSSKIRQAIIDTYTDYFVVAPTHASLLYQSNYTSTWLYEFRHRSVFSTKERWEGVAHGDITAYVFGVPLLNASSPHPYTAVDRNISDMMVTLYTNFVKSGFREQPETTNATEWEWREFKSSDQAYLCFEQNPRMATNYHPVKIAFWNNYITKISKYSPSADCEAPEVKGSHNMCGQKTLDFLITTFAIMFWAKAFL